MKHTAYLLACIRPGKAVTFDVFSESRPTAIGFTDRPCWALVHQESAEDYERAVCALRDTVSLYWPWIARRVPWPQYALRPRARR